MRYISPIRPQPYPPTKSLHRKIQEFIETRLKTALQEKYRFKVLAYLVLSRWHYKISELSVLARTFANIIYGELPNASLDEAEKLLLKAIGLHDRISHRYNLAKIYDRMDRREDANVQYDRALLLPVTFPEEAEELVKAREKLQNRLKKSEIDQ